METTATLTEKSTTLSRLNKLKDDVTSFPYSVCIERAVRITEYFKIKDNRKKPIVIQKAEALAHLLRNKKCLIYDHERIVGTTTSKRVAGPLYPELHGLPVMEDLLSFSNRKLNPLQIEKPEINKLATYVIPFWANKFLAYQAFSGKSLLRFVMDQLSPRFYLINETGGIGHLIPDYESLMQKGLLEVIAQHESKRDSFSENHPSHAFHQAVIIICQAVIDMSQRYAQEAERMAVCAIDEQRKSELMELAGVLRHVPAHPARGLYDALQSVWMLHIAITLEGLDNGISLGRMDQYLFPFYKSDVEKGALTSEQAKELIGCFVIKTAEIIPVFSNKISKSHGGFLSGQALTIGGTDSNGNDVVNDVSYVFLELMDEIRMRQPNYHARIHAGSPRKYLEKIMGNLVKGVNSPAIYNDELIIRSLERCGMSHADAMEYSTLGCVELCSAGKTFGSTDAALLNVPICLEMALNGGKTFGSITRRGYKTILPSQMKCMEDVKQAFVLQVKHLVDELHQVLAPIEEANRDFHPTPLTSALIQGCIESSKDVTAGGATYNFSGVQGVGITDVADSLFAIEQIVFVQKKYSLTALIGALKNNFNGEERMRMDVMNLPKFGNDNVAVDAYARWVSDVFYDAFEGLYNTRGGRFVAGFYSTTTHYSFGLLTGAMANGRLKGQPFTSGIAPTNGMDKNGPTALFNSIVSIDFERAHNGANVNAKFDTATLRGDHGKDILQALLLTYFKKGGMQVQLNVLDTEMLKDAKLYPEKYPWLIVRVSGYSAYFNDLSPAMKDEIIQRSTLSC